MVRLAVEDGLFVGEDGLFVVEVEDGLICNFCTD